MRHKIWNFRWYGCRRGRAVKQLLVGSDAQGIWSSDEYRYRSATAEQDRPSFYSRREKFSTLHFFVSVVDVSLAVDAFPCGSFDAVTVMAMVILWKSDELIEPPLSFIDPFSRYTTINATQLLNVGCLWKPKPKHPECDCDRDMMKFAFPAGPCSPTCSSTPFSFLHRGSDADPDWTLTVSRDKFYASGRRRRGMSCVVSSEVEDGGLAAAASSRWDGVSGLVQKMNLWKSGALLLSARLNAATFALIGARERLVVCAQGIVGRDMTGCAPGFPQEFYTDMPVSILSTPTSTSSSNASYRLELEVRRDRWNPVSLSRWYVAFLDSSRGNRTCWLARGMVNDSRSSYREPVCDGGGLCDPLEFDDKTLAACEAKRDRRLGPECPVTCAHPCFGPLCH